MLHIWGLVQVDVLCKGLARIRAELATGTKKAENSRGMPKTLAKSNENG